MVGDRVGKESEMAGEREGEDGDEKEVRLGAAITQSEKDAVARTNQDEAMRADNKRRMNGETRWDWRRRRGG